MMCYEILSDDFGNLFDVESEGKKLTPNKDPPGQKSIYITPGNTARETYRLSTFQHYPIESPINPFQFSSNGFYYTGYKDRVKCFSCGACSESWSLFDDVTSTEWHDSNCDFINGRDRMNIPILSVVRKEMLLNNQGKPPVEIFPSGECSTDLKASTSNNVLSSISTLESTNNSFSFSHSTNVFTGSKNLSSSLESNKGLTLTSKNQENLFETFPCLSPINPHMRNADMRRQTFLDNAANWPAQRIQASPNEIVQAGMFYLGERDRVKCWYCNGGLQNWEWNDDPWEEHAKWFPLCEYLLQQKGPVYVQNIVSRFPGLVRPALYNSSVSNLTKEIARVVNQSQRRNYRDHRATIAHYPTIVDPKIELVKRKNRIEIEMTSSDIASQARMLGFEDEVIKKSLEKKYGIDDKSFSSFEELLDSLLSIDDEEDEQEPVQASSKINDKINIRALNEVEQLEILKLCKMCQMKDACIVFIPCGHLLTCLECSQKIKKCPICKEFVKQKVRSYLS